jgi:hypothetical protein
MENFPKQVDMLKGWVDDMRIKLGIIPNSSEEKPELLQILEILKMMI